MLTPQEIEAINNLSERSKTIMAYALKAFNQDVNNLEGYCNIIDPNNQAMQQFHANVRAHSNAMLNTVELMAMNDSPLCLIEQFAPVING